MTAPLSFSVNARDGRARTGTLSMRRGDIRTPAFMPVGTAATVKAMKPETVRETGADIILGNTYHLMLRPGAERIARLGGLHKFMNWSRPILTDSGGFQVMSLAKLRKITEDGVTFQSHIDGSRHLLSPERSMEIQRLLGADIVMAFDECTPYPATPEQARHSMELSMRWAKRSRQGFDRLEGAAAGSALFGIVQGSTFENLRRESAAALLDIGFEGYAVGGLAVGEGAEVMFDVLDYTVPLLPEDRPRYLMGVGKPSDIVGAVRRGIDMFDCVLPTRSGRNAQAFTRRGTVNLKNARHQDDPRPLDEACRCSACRSYSRAYLSHLVRAGEILGAMLLTEHNLTYYQDLMQGLRDAIAEQRLDAFIAAFEAAQAEGNIAPMGAD
ncbi:MAG: tRNA guanosine(34) transglycosylase Tgt [Alphaproteobacteria bacterium]|nr:MAG: tRNA guanosine(34) transglycosylase Tgt [Alphaproteobacteria bacterium]